MVVRRTKAGDRGTGFFRFCRDRKRGGRILTLSPILFVYCILYVISLIYNPERSFFCHFLQNNRKLCAQFSKNPFQNVSKRTLDALKNGVGRRDAHSEKRRLICFFRFVNLRLSARFGFCFEFGDSRRVYFDASRASKIPILRRFLGMFCDNSDRDGGDACFDRAT